MRTAAALRCRGSTMIAMASRAHPDLCVTADLAIRWWFGGRCSSPFDGLSQRRRAGEGHLPRQDGAAVPRGGAGQTCAPTVPFLVVALKQEPIAGLEPVRGVSGGTASNRSSIRLIDAGHAFGSWAHRVALENRYGGNLIVGSNPTPSAARPS
jgi:hypothetical protein